MKNVQIHAHEFDCLPGHVSVGAMGKGSTLKAAVCNAIREMFTAPSLKRKRVGSFKISVVVRNESLSD